MIINSLLSSLQGEWSGTVTGGQESRTVPRTPITAAESFHKLSHGPRLLLIPLKSECVCGFCPLQEQALPRALTAQFGHFPAGMFFIHVLTASKILLPDRFFMLMRLKLKGKSASWIKVVP